MPEAATRLKKGAQAALSGDKSAVENEFMNAGQICINSVKDMIQAGLAPPLSPKTIRARERRLKMPAGSLEDSKALIDTGAFIASLTYVVKDK